MDGKADERIVTVGETVGDQIEITSGIAKGELVAAAPKGHLTDGTPVRAR